MSLRTGGEAIWMNYVHLKVHCVNFPSKGVIVSKAYNYESNRRLLEIIPVALRAPRNDMSSLDFSCGEFQIMSF